MRSRVKRHNDHGFTLIEVLAAVVILSAFIVALMPLMNQMFTQSSLNAQKEKAVLIARGIMAQVAQQGAADFLSENRTIPSQGPYIIKVVPVNPSWANGLTDVEVIVSWSTSINGVSEVQNITLEQAFPS